MHYSRSSHKLNPTHTPLPPLPPTLAVFPFPVPHPVVPILSVPFHLAISTSRMHLASSCMHAFTDGTRCNVSPCANQLVEVLLRASAQPSILPTSPFLLSKCVFMAARENGRRDEAEDETRERERGGGRKNRRGTRDEVTDALPLLHDRFN